MSPKTLLFFLILAAPPALAQQDWPSRPVVLVNPFAAASAVDVVARLVAQRMTQTLGKSILVENRTGRSEEHTSELQSRG